MSPTLIIFPQPLASRCGGHSVRVIAGQFRGRKLVPVHTGRIRPAADRVKESIFNVIQNNIALAGIGVLDLFAGTGSLGIEAISRGAGHVTFVDVSDASLRIVRSNIKLLRCEQQCTLVKAEATKYIETTERQFDIVFADPPYAFRQTGGLPERIFAGELLKKEGFLIIEHTDAADFPESSLYRRTLRKEFGQTFVSFFTNSA